MFWASKLPYMKTIMVNVFLPILIFLLGIGLGHFWTKVALVPPRSDFFTCYNQLYLEKSGTGYTVSAESTGYIVQVPTLRQALKIVEDLTWRDALILSELESPFVQTISDTVIRFDYKGVPMDTFYDYPLPIFQ